MGLYGKRVDDQHPISMLYIRQTRCQPFSHKRLSSEFMEQHSPEFRRIPKIHEVLRYRNHPTYNYSAWLKHYMRGEDIVRLNIMMNNTLLMKISYCHSNFKKNLPNSVDLWNFSGHTLIELGFDGILLRHAF